MLMWPLVKKTIEMNLAATKNKTLISQEHHLPDSTKLDRVVNGFPIATIAQFDVRFSGLSIYCNGDNQYRTSKKKCVEK